MIVALIVALVIVADSRTKAETQLNKLNKQNQNLKQQIKKLQDDNQKLKIEGEKREEAKKILVQSPVKSRVQPVRASNFVGGKCEQYRPLVSQYPWNVETALQVMYAESGCNPNSLSRTADRGLMQINQAHADKVGGDLNRLFDPVTNVNIAFQIYQASGWSPWSVCRLSVNCL